MLIVFLSLHTEFEKTTKSHHIVESKILNRNMCLYYGTGFFKVMFVLNYYFDESCS